MRPFAIESSWIFFCNTGTAKCFEAKTLSAGKSVFFFLKHKNDFPSFVPVWVFLKNFNHIWRTMG
jgi:hypothetical protein